MNDEFPRKLSNQEMIAWLEHKIAEIGDRHNREALIEARPFLDHLAFCKAMQPVDARKNITAGEALRRLNG